LPNTPLEAMSEISPEWADILISLYTGPNDYLNKQCFPHVSAKFLYYEHGNAI
jgi:hypothetical protein